MAPLQHAHWFALWTRCRHEFTVYTFLNRQRIEVFLPTYTQTHQWSDRKKSIDLPLFPGYCLARFAWRDKGHVVRTPGIAGIVGINGKGVPIPDGEVADLQQLQRSGMDYDPSPYLRTGMRVRVFRGPLSGLTGVLLSRSSDNRLVLGVNLLQRGASIQIDARDVMPLDTVVPAHLRTLFATYSTSD